VTDLFPRLLPVHRETLPSFLSRLAASKDVKTLDLAMDMGFSFKRLLNQDEEALDRLRSWARLSNDELTALRSWTGSHAGNVTTLFRGEVFGSRALRNPVVRGCPVCLQEDATEHSGDPLEAMAMRGDWQLREVTICLRHRHPLVPLWEEHDPVKRLDIQSQLGKIADRLLDGSLRHSDLAPSAYDIWLDHRLETGEDQTWLSRHTLYAATAFCRLLGGELLRPRDIGYRQAEVDLRAAQAEGFKHARQGEAAIRQTLEDLAVTASRALLEAPTAFGWLFAKLSHDYRVLPEFDIFRDILREVILSIWPVGPGEFLLGREVSERRLHSVRTAALETGVGEVALEQFLTEAGAFASGDDRPRSRRTFSANIYAALLADVASLVTAIDLAQAMGATRGEIDALIRGGVLTPQTQSASIKLKWRTQDGLALNAELQTLAVPIPSGRQGWERLQAASARAHIPVANIISAIRSGELQVGRVVTDEGYHGFSVRKSSVDQWRKARADHAMRAVDTLPGVMSAAEFARSIGLRDKRQFEALIEAGHAEALETVHPVTRRVQLRMTSGHIASFHGKFLTLTTMQAETGLHRNTILSRLKASGVAVFAADRLDFGPVYLRQEAMPELRTASAKEKR